MPFHCTIHRDRRLIQVVFTGPTALWDLVQAREAVTRLRGYQPGFALLIDLVDADLESMNAPQLREHALRPPGAGRIAIVVSTDFAYGMARMYEMVSPTDVGVFRDGAEAFAWLAAAGDGAGG